MARYGCRVCSTVNDDKAKRCRDCGTPIDDGSSFVNLKTASVSLGAIVTLVVGIGVREVMMAGARHERAPSHERAKKNFVRACKADGSTLEMCTCLADEIIPKRTMAELKELDRQATNDVMPDTLKFLIQDTVFVCTKKLER